MAKRAHIIDRVHSAQARSETGDPHPGPAADPRRRGRARNGTATSGPASAPAPTPAPRSSGRKGDPLAEPDPHQIRNPAGDRKRDDRTPRKR